ncbi:hypothetical protein Emag_002420 [Eimeria magna]
MGRSAAVDLSVLPHTSHARLSCWSARFSPMQRVAPFQYIKDRGMWSSLLFLTVVAASLLPSAATAQCASRQVCTESSSGKNCSRDLAKADAGSSIHDDRRSGESCLEVDVASARSLVSAEAAATGLLSLEQEQGAIVMSASHMKASVLSVVRLFYAPEDEQQPVGKGTLIDGRYLLIDLLHPPRRKRPQAAFARDTTFIDSNDFALQLKGSPPSPRTAADSGGCEDGNRDRWTTQSSSTGLWQWLRDSPSSSGVSGVFPLLLSPAGEAAHTARAGAAFAAAVVSVHSELVLAKHKGQRMEGFCIDPFMYMSFLLPVLFEGPQVWRAVSVDSAAPVAETVLKRMYCRAFDRRASSAERPEKQQQQQEQEARVRRGFAREVFFGLWLRGLPHVARFLEVLPADPHDLGETSDEQAAPPPTTAEGADSAAAAAAAAAATFLPEMSIDELFTAARSAAQGCRGEWLVFANEGISLTHLFFVADTGGSGLLEPSALWWHLKASARFSRPPRRMRHLAAAAAASAAASADAPFRPLLLQLQENPTELLLFLRSLLQQLLQALHAAHERHVTHRDVKLENVLLRTSLPPDARLADWGSAVSNDENSRVAQALKALLGDESPSVLEETDGYQPPEVWAEAAAMEGQEKQEDCQRQGSDASVGSGTCNSQESSEAIPSFNSPHRPPSYDIWGVGLIFLKLVLGTPTPLEPLEGRRGKRFAEILKARDAAGVGVPNPLARDLLRKLLAYDPQERLTAEAALQHPWFAVAPEAAVAVNEATDKDF